MDRKTRHLSLRLTENQFIMLAEKLVDEQKTISEVTRDLIKDYIEDSNNKIIDGIKCKN
jgi:hypothetical protein